jgi:hypothetical protein
MGWRISTGDGQVEIALDFWPSSCRVKASQIGAVRCDR